MNRRWIFLFGLVSASGVAALVGACGGGDSTATDGGGDATTQDTGTGNDTGTGIDTGTDTGPANDGGADVQCTGTGFGCRQCCAGLYPDAAAQVRADERTCACTTPGDCNTPQLCGNNFCNNAQPNGACTACLLNPDAGGCAAAAISACANDTACQPFFTCVQGCMATDAGGGG